MTMVRTTFLLLCVLYCFAPEAVAQQTALAADENMKPDAFAQILKTEWTFLRDEMDTFISTTKEKDEFETTPEFNQRKARQRADLLVRFEKRLKEQKFDTRVLKVLLKANPKKYDADTEEYILTCTETIEAPYNIPSVVCIIPQNKYVALSDSVERGFRFSKIGLFPGEEFKWRVTRDIARMAKNAQSSLYFKVHFVLSFRMSESGAPQAVLEILPRQIELVDVSKNMVFWRDTP